MAVSAQPSGNVRQECFTACIMILQQWQRGFLLVEKQMCWLRDGKKIMESNRSLMYPFLQKNAVPTTAVSQWENEGLISRQERIHAESIGAMQPFETVCFHSDYHFQL